MDEHRFDELSRRLGGMLSRRQGMAAVLGAVLGGATATRGADDKGGAVASAKSPCGDGSAKANRCKKAKDCCTNLCVTKNGKKSCQCVQAGKSCSSSKNCCDGGTCKNGKCTASSGCSNNGDCTGTTDTCTSNGTCTCGNGAACSGSTPHCSNGTCVGCSASSQCISIVDNAYDPPTLSVDTGATVTWTNNGNLLHTVTATDQSFGSGNLPPGATFSHTFATAGSFEYRCNIHGSMTGTVEVQ